MNQLVLPESLKRKRMKAIRFHLIAVGGRFVQHARGLYMKLSGGEAVYEQMKYIRERIAMLAQAPPAVS